MVVIGKRENFNAHSFDLASLYITVNGQWEAVTVFDADKERDQLTSSGGADCVLHDFRLSQKSPQKPFRLIVADREFGNSFVDVQPVVFRIYSLTNNADNMPGRPTWYFELRATRTSRKSYCDVGEAFDQEAPWRE